MLNIATVAALALIAYDGILHTVTLVRPRVLVGEFEDQTDLPWLLYPTFNSWQAYDITWAALHLAAFAILSVALIRSRLNARRPSKPE